MLHWAQTDGCDILQLMSDWDQMCLQVVIVYSGTPHIEEYLQAYLRLARIKGEEVSRVCAFHCSKVVKAAGVHQYDTPLHLCMPETVYLTPPRACSYVPHIHSAVQALARHNKMEVRMAIAKQLPQMAQVLNQDTCHDFLARYAKLQLQCAQVGVITCGKLC